ncbi:CYSTEINE-RICH REPEAT SECRETORY PROTEIN [Salix viminalis]|uniref:CYSTEINE-RICH REPEAT SECRETORY PROTEIN n=1 Tax=Salix viminalis TaxID=40686 RepID=A0A9Q0U8B9_SALVM|nr:CYSTEINE-RICH REPEAT SECRETORY PROTEIN [Salix viminalis]
MGSKTTVPLLLHLIILSITLTDAQDCYNTGNFTANSTYAKNRDLVLRSLASNVTANGGFYNTTIGSGNDTVYGLVHCMASSSAENCSSCVNYAIQGLMTACPYQKEALSWERNPLPCIVRYANRYFFGSLEQSPTSILYNTGKIDATQFDQAWSAVRDIATRANSTRNMLAAETTDLSSTQTIYVYMQCTPDVSQSNCGECLQQSVDDYKSCCYSYQGGVVQKPNCFFRWDLYPYYNLFPQVTSPSPPALPSPPASPSPPSPASPSPPSPSPSSSQFCYTTGNFAAKSTYEKNRDLVLGSLASNVTANGGFYNTTIGSGNDTVYGLVHCMASPPAENCSFCVNYSIQALMTACRYNKEALSWGRDPVPCIVRYANRYFFGSLELSPTSTLYNTSIIEATVTQSDQAWSAVREIATRANSTNSSRNMLAAETTDLSSTQTIYLFMQCTPDVSQSNCGECLQQSVDDYKSCCYSSQGGGIQKPNCFFRWDLYPYYNLFPRVTSPSPSSSVSPSPSPPFIGKENTTSRTVIVTTVPTAILLALVILILAIFRFRKPKQQDKNEEKNHRSFFQEQRKSRGSTFAEENLHPIENLMLFGRILDKFS